MVAKVTKVVTTNPSLRWLGLILGAIVPLSALGGAVVQRSTDLTLVQAKQAEVQKLDERRDARLDAHELRLGDVERKLDVAIAILQRVDRKIPN